MTFSSSLLAAVISLAATRRTGALEHECTHGKLYMVDDVTSNLFVVDVSTGLDDLSVEETTLALPSTGAGQLVLQSSLSGKDFAVIYRGNIDMSYQDGFVNFVDTGVKTVDHGDHFDVEYGSPSLISNAAINCARPIHFVSHDEKIAIFCDGDYEGTPQVNSTVWVLDEALFGTNTDSAVIYTESLQGSHHGVAIPVDDNHLLYSLATEERVNRGDNGTDYALPGTFQVVNYQGQVLHSITDTTDQDKSCKGFHGSSAIDNTFALACDDEHGGILIVDYEEPSSAYSSRALLYPENFEDHRTGSFIEHPDADVVVGNFASSENFYLLAFAETDTVLGEGNLLPLPARQCDFAFELGAGMVVLALLPTGMLHAFEFHDGEWEELATVQVVPDMTDCSDAVFAPGVGQAFVASKSKQTLFAVDLDHVHEGEMEVTSLELPFVATDLLVAGTTDNAICTADHDHDGDHDGDGEKDGSSAGTTCTAPLTSFAFVALASVYAFEM